MATSVSASIDEGNGGSSGQPWCNSHYSRQLIGWAIPSAFSGQQFDAKARELTFRFLDTNDNVDPGTSTPRRLPFFAGSVASGVVDRTTKQLIVHSGSLENITVRFL
jgi:hypothetical protein